MGVLREIRVDTEEEVLVINSPHAIPIDKVKEIHINGVVKPIVKTANQMKVR